MCLQISGTSCGIILMLVSMTFSLEGCGPPENKPNLQTKNELTCKIIGPLALHDLLPEEVVNLRRITKEIIAGQKLYYVDRCDPKQTLIAEVPVTKNGVAPPVRKLNFKPISVK